jgi:predicted DNA-binding protein (UPF0278 family)
MTVPCAGAISLMSIPNFLHLGSEQISELVHGARERVIYCAPGLQQSVAAAIINARNKIGRDAVRVILDVDDGTSRMGYGEFDAVTLLAEGDVDVRVEPGLRTCVVVCDDTGYAFFTPPMLVEVQDDEHVGANALALVPEQLSAVVNSLLPPTHVDQADEPEVELGNEQLSDQRMEQVKAALDANPPQRFDLARKVNVFNAFIEFVELKLTGLHIARHTVRLPPELVLALKDDATAKRLLTTFKLVGDESKVAKEASEIDQAVRAVRELYTRSLGDGLGTVILRSKKDEFDKSLTAIRSNIGKFQNKVLERLEKELEASRKRLVDGLLPAVKKSPPETLKAQVSGKLSMDVLRRFLDDELKRVFPSAISLVGEMKLENVEKGVTYATLCNPEFQQRVRLAFPYENLDKPFREFEAAPSTGTTGSLFA